MRRTMVALALVGALALLAAPIYAGGGKIGNVRPAAGGSFTDGPYAAATPDSGTCGPNWAVDLFKRQFVIKPQNQDGSWTVIEKFVAGKFVTLGDGQSGAASSPGACNGGTDNGNKLKEGITGTFTGSFTISIPPGFTFTGNGGCGTLSDWSQDAGQGSTPGLCTTKGWVATHFVGATYDIPKFSFTYTAKIGGVTKQWTNADTGNTGDICTSGSC